MSTMASLVGAPGDNGWPTNPLGFGRERFDFHQDLTLFYSINGDCLPKKSFFVPPSLAQMIKK